jgi:hypothetical protein
MDIALLKKLKKGEQIDTGILFPGVDETEVRWTVTNTIDGTRIADDKSKTLFRVVEFDLDYSGVSLGSVRGFENDKGGISWEAVK